MGLGKVLYGAFFCAVLPLMLAGLAWAATDWVRIPVPRSLVEAGWAGWAVLALGALLMGSGMLDLAVRGGGLPMNAFPPPRLVRDGIYRWLGQPIYLGAIAIAAGSSIVCDSASGLWLVTPLLALGAATLTFGHERLDLRRRFGERHHPIIGLPRSSGDSAPWMERVGTLLFVLVPWLILFSAVSGLPAPPDAVSAYLPLEAPWPILPWTELIYATAYLAVPAAFLRSQSREQLRRLGEGGLWATAIIGLLWWTVPLVAPPRPLGALTDSPWVDALLWERSFDDPIGLGAFPSFHVTWTFLCAAAFRRRGVGATGWCNALLWTWAVAVSVSCVTTGMHAAIDVLAGFVVFLGVHRREAAWSRIRRASERLANGWREWRLGPVRVINHGAFGALGALAGCLVVSSILGAERSLEMWVLGGASIVTAGLWAQIVEGESVSLRPFGYYGAVVGIALGGGLLWLLGYPPVEGWAAFAVGAPLIQALGRCRCLIQGCCHGQPCSPAAGIVVEHPKSRVVKLAGLGGTPIYPTQTYSILANVATALIMARLWSLHVPASALVGAYLVLAGAARFIEEAYRGEPQTPKFSGLPIYQWNAVISFAVGLAFLAWPSTPLASAPGLSELGIASSAAFAATVGALMGIDFPSSTARFGRLTK